jgi:hypothetical protein
MKNSAIPAFVILLLLSVFLVPQVSAGTTSINNHVTSRSNSQGGTSEVNVNISNQANTNSNNGSEDNEVSENTSVHISQDGDGESSVKINDKEWKLNGPGEINVQNGNSVTKTPKPTSSPTDTPTSSPTSSPTASPSGEPEEQNEDGFNGLIEMLENLLNKFKELKLKI